MLEAIETSLYLLEYRIHDSFINLRQRLREKRGRAEFTFDSEVLESYK